MEHAEQMTVVLALYFVSVVVEIRDLVSPFNLAKRLVDQAELPYPDLELSVSRSKHFVTCIV